MFLAKAREEAMLQADRLPTESGEGVWGIFRDSPLAVHPFRATRGEKGGLIADATLAFGMGVFILLNLPRSPFSVVLSLFQSQALRHLDSYQRHHW